MTRHIISAAICLSAFISVSACSSTQIPTTQSFEPVVSDLGIQVGASGLAELQAKVMERGDAVCSTDNGQTECIVSNGHEVYTFTTDAHPAHHSVLYRGYTLNEETGETSPEMRGWYAGTPEAVALTFFLYNADIGTTPLPR